MAKPKDLAVGMTRVLADEYDQLHYNPDHREKFSDSPPYTLQDVYQAIHELPASDRRTGLCLSGGGIRSASFGLGILQALAKKDILRHFHYLSTVSGGGYIGAWLSMWRKSLLESKVGDDEKLMAMMSGRREAEVDLLLKTQADLDLKEDDQYSDEHAYREANEITVLRENSNFLTPKLGAMSADTWTLVAFYIRNLLLNWLVYLPLFSAALLVPLIAEGVMGKARVAPPLCHHILLVSVIALYVFAVFISCRGRLTKTTKRGVGQATFLRYELLPIYVASCALCLYAMASYHHPDVAPPASGIWSWFGKIAYLHFAITGAAIYALGWLVAYIGYGDHDQFWEPISIKGGNPMPPPILLVCWTVAGAVAGSLVYWGFHLIWANGWIIHPRGIVVLGVGWIALSIFLANAVYLALTSYSRHGDVEREWLARTSGWFIAMTVAWAILSAITLKSPDIVSGFVTLIGVIFGGSLGAIAARLGSSAKTIASAVSSVGRKQSGLTTLFLSAGTLVFLVAITVGLAYVIPIVVAYFSDLAGYEGHSLRANVVALVACVVLVFALSATVNVNRFSAHGLYRNRLIRAFLGAGRGLAGIHSEKRDPFTGFDPDDNVRVSTLTMPPEPGKTRLFPVINMALNTVAGANRAWQERKAESFTVSPLHSGNEWVKYWPTGSYCSRTGMTLGTAIAISGAAASPNMGYHSSPLVGLIMTLFNVRLGWWLGNPSLPKAAPMESPPFGMIQFVQELFGLTNDERSYVYLSDGGHFENLGLYEMIRRRCHFILVSDAGCDPNCAFEDLGNAVRKIWIDLGVKIKFKNISIEKRREPDKTSQGVYCALAKIEYPEQDSPIGYLLYLKPCFLGTEPADIRAYAAAHEAFPHESTADQFFSESQMESYRALGAHIVETVLGKKSREPSNAPMAALDPYWQNIKKFRTAPESSSRSSP